MPWSNSDPLVRVLMISHVWGRIHLILYIECKTEIEYPQTSPVGTYCIRPNAQLIHVDVFRAYAIRPYRAIG